MAAREDGLGQVSVEGTFEVDQAVIEGWSVVALHE